MILRLDPNDLDGSPPSPATWNILKTTLGVPCVSGSIIGRPRIQPGDVEGSVIHELISERGTLQMPPIASRLVDTRDVAVVAAWIQSLAPDSGVAPADAGTPEAGTPNGDQDASTADAAAPSSGDETNPTPDADMTGIEMADAEIPDGGASDESSIDHTLLDAGSSDEPSPDGDMPGADTPDADIPDTDISEAGTADDDAAD
jgi:hypothetical protein